MLVDKKKLNKLRMPERKNPAADDMDLGMDLEDKNESPDEEQAEGPEGSEHEEAQESPEEESQELEHIPDDALIAELKKRGLMSKLADDESQEDDHSLMA